MPAIVSHDDGQLAIKDFATAAAGTSRAAVNSGSTAADKAPFADVAGICHDFEIFRQFQRKNNAASRLLEISYVNLN